MPAQIEVDESNGSLETITHDIASINMGDVDLVAMDPSSHPIIPGNRSIAKYNRIHVVNMATSSRIDDIRIWLSDAPSQGATHKSNLKTSSYGGAGVYATPVNVAITGVDQDMPIALPSSANLGIGGSLTGALTAIGYSDYFIHQVITGVNDTQGQGSSINVQYGEVL